jgi:hypothetical protein
VLPNLENRGAAIHALTRRSITNSASKGAYGDMRVRLTRDTGHAAASTPHAMFAPKVDAARRKADADRQGAA